MSDVNALRDGAWPAACRELPHASAMQHHACLRTSRQEPSTWWTAEVELVQLTRDALDAIWKDAPLPGIVMRANPSEGGLNAKMASWFWGRPYDIPGPGILHTSPGAGALDARLGHARPPPRFLDRTVPGRSVSPVHNISRLGRNSSPPPGPPRRDPGRQLPSPRRGTRGISATTTAARGAR